MPFHRFETYSDQLLTIHLSSAKGPIIEGGSIYFCLVTKQPGTGSEVHYHPNEQFQVPLAGKMNALVGLDRRIIAPGSMTHIPLFMQHQIRATEDGPLTYLYIKSKDWTTVGLAVDERLPDAPGTIAESNARYAAGEWPGMKEKGGSKAKVDNAYRCFYTYMENLDVPYASTTNINRMTGVSLIGEMADLGPGYEREIRDEEEYFCYVISGTLQAECDGESRSLEGGDIMQVPRLGRGNIRVPEGANARVFTCQATEKLWRTLTQNTNENV